MGSVPLCYHLLSTGTWHSTSTCQCTAPATAPYVHLESPSYAMYGFLVMQRLSPAVHPYLCNHGSVGLLRNLPLVVQIRANPKDSALI